MSGKATQRKHILLKEKVLNDLQMKFPENVASLLVRSGTSVEAGTDLSGVPLI